MAWIQIDPNELGAASTMLRDTGLALEASSQRIRSSCCTPGLGRHSVTLMAEGEGVATRTVRVTEDYVRLAIEAVVRAIQAAADNARTATVSATGLAVGAGRSTIGVSTVAIQTLPEPRTPNSPARRPGTPKTANEVAMDAIAMRIAVKRANAVMGIGNPMIGLSKSGLATYEQTFGTTFMGHSSSDQRP